MPQALDPALVDRLGHGRLLIEAGNPVGRDHQIQQPLLHLLLDDVLERLGHRAALRRIGEGHLAPQAWILQIRPLRRRLPDAEPGERLLAVENAVVAQHGADPQALLVPICLAGVEPRDDAFGEPFRMPFQHAAVDEVSGLRLFFKIIGAAAEKEVDAAVHVGGQKRPPGGLGRRVFGGRQTGLDARIGEGVRHLVAPSALERVGPVVLERCRVFAIEVARDLARAADDPPVDENRFAGLLPVPALEAEPELVADGLVVRRDDDQRDVRPHCRRLFRPQQERQGDRGRQDEEDDRAFHQRSD